MKFTCPGSQKFTQPQPENIRCASCGAEVEIWTDEVSARCPACGKVTAREEGQGCLDWCRYAKECVGEEAFKKYLANKEAVKKEREKDR